MKKILIPNYGVLSIENILFDINGTLQFKGVISNAVISKFQELKRNFNVYLISADTRGNLKELAEKLDVDYVKIAPKEITEAEAKNIELEKLGKARTIAVGNGNNDALMLKNAALGIAIMGSEGLTVKSLLNSDIVAPDPLSALELLLDEKSLIATLRS